MSVLKEYWYETTMCARKNTNEKTSNYRQSHWQQFPDMVMEMEMATLMVNMQVAMMVMALVIVMTAVMVMVMVIYL